MAFSNRFHFRYDSIHGVEYNIYILQDGYLGNCDERHLGRAPVLRKQKNGPICGTSLDLFAECVIDGEFAELFTSNPKEYRVDIMRRVNGADVLVWQGFVSTELYSEPSIYPPYDVQIVSTDGLGELKLVDFVPAGPITLSEHFQSALAYTGMNRTIYVASSLVMTGESRTATFDMAINLDYMDGSNYYEVISKLLDTLHATITLYGDKWLILRETDVHSLLSESGLSVVSIAANGTISTTIIGGVHKTVGSMADNSMDTWPVGQLSTAIEPSRKEVTVEAPWHTISGPDDQNMEATIGSPWVTEGIVRHDTTDDCFYELGLDPEHLVSDDTWGTIKQEIPINKLDCGFRLRLRVAPRVYKLRVGDPQWYAHGNIKVHLEYDCYISSGSHVSERTSTYIGTAEGWKGAPQHTSDPKVEIPTTELDSIGERWLSVDIPAISTPESASRYIVSDSATVRIVIEGHWVEVYECILTPSLDLPGYRDIIHLDNDAVGASSPIEITGGRVRSDNLVNSRFYGGIWIYNDAIVTSFADSVHSNGDFLSITALSYALSVAGRRLKTEGKINVPAAFSAVPLFITFDGILSSIETWEWDLFQEELSISAISLPSVEIDVESETVEGLEEDYSGRSSGGSGTGSSASSAYSYKSGGSSFFEEDGQGGIQLKEEYAGLRTKGYLIGASDGGPGGGGGGGGLIERLWRVGDLSDDVTDFDNTANDTFNAYTINSLHTRIKALELNPGGVSSVAGLTGAVSASDLFTALGLGTAATRAVGAIENANTGLVTGGDVYSFVNSSVATATATFRGTNTTATTEADFLAWANALTKTLNDYVFWKTTDSYGNTVFKRYKYGYDGTEAGSLAWRFEYDLNNSSFTAAQWAAINSGITATDVTTLGTLDGYFVFGVLGTDHIPELPTSKISNLDTTLNSISASITALEKMFIDDTYTVDGQTKHRIKVNSTYFEGLITTGFLIGAADGGPGGGGGGGGIDLNLMWASLQNTTPDTHATDKFHKNHLPAIVQSDGISAGYTLDSGNLATHLNIGISSIDMTKVSGLSQALGNKADASALGNYLPLTGGQISSSTTSTPLDIHRDGQTFDAFISFSNSVESIKFGLRAPYTNYGLSVVDPSDNYYKVWHQGNDGAGSGLDADLLDGQHASYYAKASSLSSYALISSLGSMAYASTGDYFRYYGNEIGLAASANIGAGYGYESDGWRVSGAAITFGIGVNKIQMQGEYRGDDLYFRTLRGDTESFTNWRKIYNSGNFVAGVNYQAPIPANTYAPYNSAGYLPLSGGTLTGSGPDVLTINRTGSEQEYSWIAFKGNSTLYGRLGAYSNKPFFHDTTAAREIWHAGNSNSTSVPWSASSLTLAGIITNSSGNILRGTLLGSGTYNILSWALYTNKFEFEFPNTTDASTGVHIPIYFGWRGGVYPLTIAANGSVGINNTSPSASYKLDVSGVIHSTAGVLSPGYGNFAASYSSSDQRLKDDIETIRPEYAIEKLMALRPSEWVWNEKSSLSGRKGAGLVAQHVEPVLPWNLEKSGEYLSLNYDMFHPYEIGSIQFLKGETDALKDEVAELRNRVETLESENKRLKEKIYA